MTNELDHAQALVDAATKGPWMYIKDFRCVVAGPEIHGNSVTYDVSIATIDRGTHADGELIAQAPNVIANLIERLAEARLAAEHWETAATRNGELYSACENQRDDAREALSRVRQLTEDMATWQAPTTGDACAAAILAALDGTTPQDPA